jgi:pimeloyl-ACP methyl ester carboxylesterase
MISNCNIYRMDLLSVISGSAQDFKLMLDYLPNYFLQFTRFHNIMFGISLGGHTAYRLASLSPAQIEGFAIAVGCPTIGCLLLTRLGIDAAALGIKAAELGDVSYDKLEKAMNKEQRRRWPRALAGLVMEVDRKVYEEFPADAPLLICNGKQDSLVPTFHTASWLEKRRENILAPGEEEKVKFFVQDNTGHSCTKEMVGMIAAWIGHMFESRVEGFGPVLSELRL